MRSTKPTAKQMQVLTSLSASECSAAAISRDWPGLTESYVRGALRALYGKDLVKPARFEHGGRRWMLTTKGRSVAEAIEA